MAKLRPIQIDYCFSALVLGLAKLSNSQQSSCFSQHFQLILYRLYAGGPTLNHAFAIEYNYFAGPVSFYQDRMKK